MTWILPKQLHMLACAPDTAALISDSSEQSQICEQSLLARSKRSPARTWSLKWKRDTWMQHLSGRMLRPSLGRIFAAKWTSSLEATLASPSAPQGSDSARTTQDISGLGSQTEFGFAGQQCVFLKTSKDISALDSEKSSENWKRSVTEQRGEYSRRLKSARLTSESGSSSWPTVCANEDSYRIGGDSQQSKCLSAMAWRGEMGWPSPSSRDHKGAPASRCTPEGYNARLDEAVILHGPVAQANPSSRGSRRGWLEINPQIWGTPRASERGDCPSERERDNPDLRAQVVLMQAWATPKASDPQHSGPNMRDSAGNYALPAQAIRESWATPECKNHVGYQVGADGTKHPRLGSQVGNHQASGKLNPRWVETLMGLPVGWTMPSCASPVTPEWTSSDCSATASCQLPQSEPLTS